MVTSVNSITDSCTVFSGRKSQRDSFVCREINRYFEDADIDHVV